MIYNTNLRVAFAAGAESQMMDPDVLAARPYGRYVAGLSVNPREEHLAHHGRVVPLTSPWWDAWTPPNGWGCKCQKVSVSRSEAERNGWTVESPPPPRRIEVTDPSTGEIYQKVPGIDKGWDYNPGRAAWGSSTARDQIDKATDAVWVDVDAMGPEDYGRPARIPLDKPVATMGPSVKGKTTLTEAFRTAIGGDAAIYVTPFGDRVRVGQELLEHLLADPKRWDGRERYFPFIKELIEDPYEIWVSFARNEVTGQYSVRQRLVKGLDVGDGKTVTLVAEATNGHWTGLTFFKGSGVVNVRKGRLIWSR